MKYQGPNKDGFERDARLLLESLSDTPDYEQWERWVQALARDYGIGDAEIWDILPEYENPTYPR